MHRICIGPRARVRAGRSLFALLSVLSLVLSLAAPCAAQATAPATAAVDGTVTDTSGGAIPGARLDVVMAGRTVATATTDGEGRYRVEVPSGVPVVLRVHHDGFADDAIDVRAVSGALTRDVRLQVGRQSDTLVVTASRTAESRQRVTAATTVITSEEIAAAGRVALADVMRDVPGIAVEGTGREGALTSVFARGGESDYNLVLIDGVRVNQNGGAYDFSRIAAAEIDRVEVVRGAQSSLWGSDAMGAVVQVFTRRGAAGEAPRVSGAFTGGSFATWRGDARLTSGARRLDYAIGAAHRRTDGAFGDILPEPDRFDQSAFDGSVGVTLGSRAGLRSAVRHDDAEGRAVGNIAYGARDTGTAYDSTDTTWQLSVPHSLGGRYTGSAETGYFRSEIVSSDRVADPTFNVYALLEGTPGALFPESPRLVRLLTRDEFDARAPVPAGQFYAFTPFGVSDFVSSSRTQLRRATARYRGDLLWADGQRLSGGYEFERENNPLAAGFRNTNHGVFLQQQFAAAERWFATAGVRVDDKSFYGTFVSPKLSAGGYLRPVQNGAVSSVKVFGNAGKGIKIPTFSERFGSAFADGNPDLKPERARSLDAGVEATLADQRVRAQVLYFDNNFEDQVEFLSSDPGFRLDGRADFINIAGSEAHGWEMEAALQRPIAGVTAAASYALVDSEVLVTVQSGSQFQPGQPLLRRPRNSGALRVRYQTGPATLNVDARFVGRRHDSSFLSLRAVPTNRTTDITLNPGYTVVGVGIDVKVARSVAIVGRIDNLADTYYESALGYPGLPRAAYAGVRLDALTW